MLDWSDLENSNVSERDLENIKVSAGGISRGYQCW